MAIASTSAMAQNITLKADQATLRSVMNKIEQQSGYDFWYNRGSINESEKISIDVKDQTLQTVLKNLFSPRRLSFELVDKTIFLKPTPSKTQENQPRSKNEIQGIVVDTEGKPIPNATIKIKATSVATIADESGAFKISNLTDDGILIVSSLGFTPIETPFSLSNRSLKIVLSFDENKLEDVQVVSTGYQSIPKERATGSFVNIDSALIRRTVTTNVLDRLDGISSGLLFNRNKTFGTQSDINIRGRSTINGEDKPLIVVDNFPYEGSIDNINPNDIKSITLLKDAAASSIWGTRAGNGVIVITTAKGNYSSKQQINLVTNLTMIDKPLLKQLPWFSAAEWIDVERFLYDKGAYTSIINNGYSAISPAVEIFDQLKKTKISSQDAQGFLDQLKNKDIREDMLDHIYRNGVNQQYALNISGGSKQHKYFLSSGFDRNLTSKQGENLNRLSITANNSFTAFKDKLELNLGLLFSTNKAANNLDSYSPSSPYEQLLDSYDNPNAVRNLLRLSYVDTAGRGKLLDWKYRPLDENTPGGQTTINSYTINAGLNYRIWKELKISLLYQFQQQQSQAKTIFGEGTYYTRNLVNTLSYINAAGTVQRVVPLGSILRQSDSYLNSNNGRVQMSYEKTFSSKHNFNAISGIEIRDNNVNNLAQTLYGLNESIGINSNSAIDFTKDYPIYYNPSATMRLNAGQLTGYRIDRYLSYYANVAYDFRRRYLISLSARKDESNLFGVKSNQKGVPLWSAGAAWNISEEDFYNIKALSYLKLRASFGYSGNVNKSLSAYLTASAIGNNTYGSLFSNIINPPNPALRWEKIKTINFAIDFATVQSRISGSFEYYIKYGTDLFGTSQLAPQSGVLTYQGNFANTTTNGFDAILNTKNLTGLVKWNSNILLSLVKSNVTRYLPSTNTNSSVISQTYNNPIEGNPYFAIYAYRWAGLDNFGDPQVLFNGVPSKAYANINNSQDRSNIRLMGSAVPTIFGSIRNSVSYKSIELSFLMTYRLGYFFRRSSLDNAQIYSTNGFQNKNDYEKRWQVPGDELTTNVPALVYPNVTQRATVYRNSDILVEKADNVKLQDIRVGWTLNSANNANSLFQNLQIFGYLNNVGYIWKANHIGIDPDGLSTGFSNLPFPKTLSFGLQASF